MISNDVNTGESLELPINILRAQVEDRYRYMSIEEVPDEIRNDIEISIASLENAIRILKESEKAIF